MPWLPPKSLRPFFILARNGRCLPRVSLARQNGLQDVVSSGASKPLWQPEPLPKGWRSQEWLSLAHHSREGQTAPHVNSNRAMAMMMAVMTSSAYTALNRHYARCFICLISFELATACRGGVIPMLQMKQLRLREAKALARSYNEHCNWNSNSGKLDPKVHRVGSAYVDKSFCRLAPSK